MTNPDIFLTQEDIPPLIQALSTLVLEVDGAQDRKNMLINAGISISSLCKLTFGENAQLFANTLVAHFREYRVSAYRPAYHPLVSLLEYLLQTYSLEDQDSNLFTQLVKHGRDNFEMLTARSAVGRIESPVGTAIGTGVMVDRQLLLTCRHVFEQNLKEDQGQAWVRFGYKVGMYGVEKGELFELDVKSIVYNALQSDHELDYALVNIISKPTYRPARLYNGIPSLTQPIRVIHHSRGEPVQISEIGQIVQVDQDFIKHTAEVDHGSSGAPIFDLQWRVIAIERGTLSLSRPSSPGVTEGIPLFCIWDRIKPYATHALVDSH
jgi:hypothetical protein